MRAITKYIADDGIEFVVNGDCEAYEILCARVTEILSEIPPRPNDINFANGHGYVQHEEEVFRKVWNALLDIFATRIDHHWIAQSRDMNADPSWVGRIIYDYDIKPFYTAWYRMICTDKSFREWGQPYYATHPEAVKPICLNLRHQALAKSKGETK